MNIEGAIRWSLDELQLYGNEVDTGHWQGIPTEGKPDLVTLEIMNLHWSALMPEFEATAAELCRPNMPWAEDHFQERVSRVPSNPGEQYKNWPWWREGSEKTTMRQVRQRSPEDFDLVFDHTYQERFWPKHKIKGQRGFYQDGYQDVDHWGIRYKYGDLDDVVNLLREHPFTRQATFPIFFPEDTGAVHGGRVPCTLHYHFLRRGDHLHLWYPIRSCDAVRHFRDDIYMAVRLCQWVINEVGKFDSSLTWRDVKPGFLHFTAYSFHVHKGDMHLL